MQLNLYGSGGHGYLANEFGGFLLLGDHTVPFTFGVMVQKEGEKGNACGIPSADSANSGGSVRLEGIFGFAGTGDNQICLGSYLPQGASLQELSCNGEKTTSPAPFQLVLEQAVLKNVFAIEWVPPPQQPEVFGMGFSTLYEGVSARVRLAGLLEIKNFFVLGKMIFSGNLYHITTYGFEVTLAGQSPQGPGTIPESSNIVDTGTPGIVMPQHAYDSLSDYFGPDPASGSATLYIYLQSEQQGGGVLEIPISAVMWRVSQQVGLFQPQSAEAPFHSVIGSPVWIWYEHVQFDVASQSFSFVPRSNFANFENNFISSALSVIGSE